MKKITALLTLAISTTAFAWQPTKPIDVTISFPAGSGNDLIFRPLASIVEKNTGVNFNIKNKPGAGGAIGNQEFVGLPNDGHFIDVASIGGIAAMDYTYPSFAKKPPYNVDSFSYAILLGYSPIAVIAKADDPVNTPKDLVQTLTTDPTASIAENGGSGKLVLETLLMKISAREKNPKLVVAEHKGPVQTITDVAGGHVRFGIAPLAVAAVHHNAGKLKVVAISSKNKVASLPDIQPISTVVKDFDIVVPWGIVLPKDAPQEALNWYSEKFKQAIKEPGVQANFAKSYIFMREDLQSPKAFKDYVYYEYKEHKRVVDFINSKTN
ncbi:PBP2_Bug_TTT domain containing protein [uncultured Caudovirales phage]|uniref:PBP2_Bug_TTT domain containing protein n=1 Tax=uncultured Caudovirales phage TaxID=2100421 RepID=A0A6J7WYT8_9CAUD|nr:PBP2_Bug_TTT domain containing protein [uncultured Caudovirales phage]